ncbi:hypothetical protein Sjap_017839 [Stephania japonica]|uniref:Uncharacterized protein n=1 Tax=Stephania japonica TaxID=461633 RepID=A0AAP0NKF7_9MAGN
MKYYSLTYLPFSFLGVRMVAMTRSSTDLERKKKLQERRGKLKHEEDEQWKTTCLSSCHNECHF